MTDDRDIAPECVRCGVRLDPALDACLGCGQPGPWAADGHGEWALQIGPISSQSFRNHAVEQLSRLDPYLNRDQVQSTLRGGPVRVASNLTKESAESLKDAFGAKEALALAVPADAASEHTSLARVMGGVAGAAALGVIALLVATAGSLMMGVFLAGGASLAILVFAAVVLGVAIRHRKVSSTPAPLTTLGVAPVVPHGAQGLVGRLHVAAHAAGDDAEVALESGRAALRLLARLSDPEDFAARIAGGADGPLGKIAADAAREIVTITEAAQGGLTSEDQKRIDRVAGAVRDAQRELASSEETQGDSIDALEEQVEAVRAQSSAG